MVVLVFIGVQVVVQMHCIVLCICIEFALSLLAALRPLLICSGLSSRYHLDVIQVIDALEAPWITSSKVATHGKTI